ncbi:MAG: flagellar export protein FliJ [Lachnospiraceae bacterium]|nr:flagellar export protein FliJ [Lachnospiraceae bacterium]
MAKFIYRMQSILNIKEKLETQAKNEFAQARIRLDEELEKLASLERRKKEYEGEAIALRNTTLDIQKINENKYALERVEEYIQGQQSEVSKAEKAFNRARDNLTRAMQETEVQNKLKERAFEDFKRELNAQEAKEVDELTSYTYGQRIKENG